MVQMEGLALIVNVEPMNMNGVIEYEIQDEC